MQHNYEMTFVNNWFPHNSGIPISSMSAMKYESLRLGILTKINLIDQEIFKIIFKNQEDANLLRLAIPEIMEKSLYKESGNNKTLFWFF